MGLVHAAEQAGKSPESGRYLRFVSGGSGRVVTGLFGGFLFLNGQKRDLLIADSGYGFHHRTSRLLSRTGPKVASFDTGFGTAYLARIVGEKRAREIWFFCRQYDAATALEWGLVNKVVPSGQLMEEARSWVKEIEELSPTALRFLKSSFNADSAQIAGQQRLAFTGLEVFGKSDEAHEGREAFAEKRSPDFGRFRGE